MDADRAATTAPSAPVARARLAPVGWMIFGAALSLVLLTRVVDAAPTWVVLLGAAQPWVVLGAVALSALLALPAWGGRRAWRPFFALAALWLAIWGRAWTPWRSGGEGLAVDVLSWNVQRLGFTDSADAKRFQCVADTIEDLHPDVLALQEVSRRDTSRLAARLGLSCEHTEYRGRNASGRGGLAVCVHAGEWSIGQHGARPYLEGKAWYFPWAEAVHTTGRVLNIVGVHLQPYGKALLTGTERVADVQSDEADALLRRVRAMRDPTLVAGDFNSVRDASVHGAMRSVLTDVVEQGSFGPSGTVFALGVVPLRVDYVYASSHFGVQEARIPAIDCADHRPVYARLRLR
jgi:endonuclease/exonuclease/phosphatase (EEP) superfamily protein YafD